MMPTPDEELGKGQPASISLETIFDQQIWTRRPGKTSAGIDPMQGMNPRAEFRHAGWQSLNFFVEVAST